MYLSQPLHGAMPAAVSRDKAIIIIHLVCACILQFGLSESHVVHLQNGRYITNSRSNHICSTLLADNITQLAVRRLLKAEINHSYQLPPMIRFGLLRLENLRIRGLDQTRINGNLHFSRHTIQSTRGDGLGQSILRIVVPLSLDYLTLIGKVRLAFTPKAIHIKVHPLEMAITFEINQFSPSIDGLAAQSQFGEGARSNLPPNLGSLAHLAAVKITRWQGVRINGEGFLVKTIRVMSNLSAVNMYIQRTVEKFIREQTNRILDDYSMKKLFYWI